MRVILLMQRRNCDVTVRQLRRCIKSGKRTVQPTATSTPEIWLSVEAAAKRLGIKPRAMLNHRDRVAHEYVDNPRSGKKVLQFRAAAVEQYCIERQKAKQAGLSRAVLAVQHAHAATGPANRPWLRIAELAAEWNVSERAIYELIRSGDLPARRFACRDPWRIHRADADALRGIPAASIFVLKNSPAG